MDHIKLFQDVVYRRSILLKGFEKVERKLFQKSIEYESWSPESLFRHLLTGMKWISGVISKEPLDIHPLALMTAANLDHSVSLAGVKVALDKTTHQLQESACSLMEGNTLNNLDDDY